MWAEARDVAAIVGVTIALVTLIKAVFEYSSHGAQKRAEHFLAMRQRFKGNESFRSLCAMLDGDDRELADVAFKEKRDLLGFFEEVALMVNSHLIREPVAHYMFGYYAVRCYQSDQFWNGVNRDSSYWSLFTDFAKRMEAMEQASSIAPSSLRF